MRRLSSSNDKQIYYLFDLECYHQLGRHRPYYEIIRSTIADVIVFNPQYRADFHDQLMECISTVMVNHLHLAPYISDRLEIIGMMERIIHRILVYAIKFDRYIIVESNVVIEDDLLIVGISKWI